MTKRDERDDTGFFVDTETGERIEDGEIDANGVAPFGEDDDGFWWGTSRAAWVLSDADTLIECWGDLGAEEWAGMFIGTVSEAADYAERHGVRILGCLSSRIVRVRLPRIDCACPRCLCEVN